MKWGTAADRREFDVAVLERLAGHTQSRTEIAERMGIRDAKGRRAVSSALRRLARDGLARVSGKGPWTEYALAEV